MKFSTKSRYALRLVADLAIHRTDGVLRLKDVASRQNITEKYAEQIISMLKHGGLVQAKRGTQGGYTLTKPAAEITIGEILRLTEETSPPCPALRTAATAATSLSTALPLPCGRSFIQPSAASLIT